MKIAILGDGAWATAVATLLAHKKYHLSLWCYDSAVYSTISMKRTNERYLPGVQLSELIKPTVDIKEALQDATVVFEAIPVKFLRSILQQCLPYYTDQQRWVILSKGIEQKTLLLPSALLDDVFNVSVHKAVVMGPSFAVELAQEQKTAFVVASAEESLAMYVKDLISSDYSRAFISNDMVGVQLCAALKNVIAICIGMLDGAYCGDNIRAYVITLGLQEIALVCAAFGGSCKTAYTVAGLGDLILTSLGSSSKNRKVGFLLGQGMKLDEIIKQFGATPEGINTLYAIQELLSTNHIKMPLLNGIYDMLFGKLSLDDFLKQCMNY